MNLEKDRMLKGELYNANDPVLSEERARARELTSYHNKLSTDDQEKRLQIQKKLLGGIGDETWIEPPLYIEYGRNTFIGKSSFINSFSVILDECQVTIGDYVLFGPGVQIYAGAHPLNPVKRQDERKSYGKPVEIGTDVWIGGKAIVCPGVKIGNGCVIGAGSVVTEDIPPFSLAVGNPCHVIKSIAEECCPKLIRIEDGSEKEKMLNGQLYYAFCAELNEGRNRSRKLTNVFNNTGDEEQEKRKEIVKELFGEVGEGTRVDPPVFCDYGSYTSLGKNVHINHGCFFLDVCQVNIGDNTTLGHSVHVYAATHPLSASQRRKVEYGKPITVGSNVLVGDGTILCPGVNIGNGSVISAGSVVTRDIPENVFAAGNPCRVVEQLDKNVS